MVWVGLGHARTCSATSQDSVRAESRELLDQTCFNSAEAHNRSIDGSINQWSMAYWSLIYFTLQCTHRSVHWSILAFFRLGVRCCYAVLRRRCTKKNAVQSHSLCYSYVYLTNARPPACLAHCTHRRENQAKLTRASHNDSLEFLPLSLANGSTWHTRRQPSCASVFTDCARSVRLACLPLARKQAGWLARA